MLTLKINDEDLKKAVQALIKELPWEMADGLDHAKRKFMSIWRSQRLRGGEGVYARPRGIFIRFQTTDIRQHGDSGGLVGLSIGTDSDIALRQEQGGQVTGNKGEMVVPLQQRTEMFKSPITGALKVRWKDLSRLKKVVPIKFKGQVYLAQVDPKNHDVKPLPRYVIKKSVKLKPRLGFQETFAQEEETLYGILAQHITKALDKIW